MDRRTAIRLGIGATGAIMLGASAATRAQAADGPATGCGFQVIGTLPLVDVTTAGVVLDAGHPDGPRVYSVTSSAVEAQLGVRDAVTGELLHEIAMPAALGSWAITVAPDHRVYAGSYSAGGFYRYDPGTRELTSLGVPVEGETFIWTVATAPDGAIWGGTSHGGHVFRHDPGTGQTTDLGTPVPGERYVRDLGIGADGTVYAGIGSTTMQVAVLAPDGTVRELIDPPAGLGNAGYAYDVDVAGRFLVVHFNNSAGERHLAAYDLDARSWGEVVTDVTSLSVGGGRIGNDVHVVRRGELVRYRLTTGAITPTGFKDFGTGGIRTLGWARVPGRPGKTLIGSVSTGKLWHYHPKSGEGQFIDGTLTDQPVAIRSLAAGPDGLVYAGGFFTGGLASYDPETGDTTGYRGIGQIEGMIAHAGLMYFGVYPGAEIHEYDPGRAWEPGTNPRRVLRLAEQEQERPFAWTSAGEQVAFGTVPTQGAVGGVLGFHHPGTGEQTVIRDVIPGHSIIGLAYRDGVVYGATSVWGGANEPGGDVAVVFAFDVAGQQVLWQTAPVEGDLALGSIAFAGDGTLWGLSPDALYQVDPETGELLGSRKLDAYPWDTARNVWLDTHLVLNPDDGLLYGKVQGKAYRIDPETRELVRIVKPASNLTRGPDGHLYLSRDHNFWTYRFC